jgi:hypothetical protein
MDSTEAGELLRASLDRYRAESYADLQTRVGSRETTAIMGASGKRYTIETQIVWDARPKGTIRVLGSIDDGGLRAILPLREDFLVDRS